MNASFTAQSPQLNPLPIEGLFYRWGVDLFGPVEKSVHGNSYCMIAIQHFSKHVELIPIPDKEPATTARFFLSHVISRFASMAEVVTDRGKEWQGEFDELLSQCLIAHRWTSPAHAQSNGLAEKCVGTIKRALRKLCEERASVRDWEDHLCWVGLGYRCSKQRSTGMSSYEMLYARQPVIPPAVHEKWQEPLDFDDPGRAAELVLARAKIVQEQETLAAANLRIAQHRDTLRYAHTHSGHFVPRLVRFQEGDYVYLRSGQVANALQIVARPHILRVKEIQPSGMVVLQGRCGNVTKSQISNLAPCHLPGIDGTIDPSASLFDSR